MVKFYFPLILCMSKHPRDTNSQNWSCNVLNVLISRSTISPCLPTNWINFHFRNIWKPDVLMYNRWIHYCYLCSTLQNRDNYRIFNGFLARFSGANRIMIKLIWTVSPNHTCLSTQIYRWIFWFFWKKLQKNAKCKLKN